MESAVPADWVLDSLPENILYIDSQMHIQWANRSAIEFSRRDKSQLFGTPCYKIWGQDHSPCPNCPVVNAIQTGQPHAGICQYSGTSLFVCGYPVTKESRGFSCIVKIASDLTDGASGKRNPSRTVPQLQEFERSTILAAGLVHDINNLLMGVMGNLHSALYFRSEASAKMYMNKAVKICQQTSDLANRFLAHLRNSPPSLKSINLSAMIHGLKELFDSTLPNQIELCFECHPSLYPIQAEPSQLQQVIMNIVINASESIGDEGGTIRVATGCQYLDREALVQMPLGDSLEEGTYVYLEIADSGCGVDPLDIQKIFTPSFSTKGHDRGTGLANVLGIVRGFKGAVDVSSQAGEGTSFRVYFPVAQEKEQDKMDHQIGQKLPQRTNTILVVDDEPVVLEVASKILTSSGHTVLTANSGLQGISCLQKTKEIDVVLLDVCMPMMTAVEVIQKMLRIRPDVKIILTSGYDKETIRDTLLGGGWSGFLKKPFSRNQLLESIQNVDQQIEED